MCDMSHRLKNNNSKCGRNDLLLKAIKRRDIAKIQNYIQSGATKSGIINGTTPLITAVQTGDINIVKAVTETKEGKCFHNPNIGYFVVRKDDCPELGEGPTPEGMEDLEWDMEVKETDSIPSTPEGNLYQWYAQILSKTSVAMLYVHEYDIGRLDIHGHSALYYAIAAGYLEIVQYLMSFAEFTAGQRFDSNMDHPLYLAIWKGHVEIVKYILSRGIDVNMIGDARLTPLHLASIVGNVEIVNLLLESNACINSYDFVEQSPAMKAVLHNHEEVARILIRKGTILNHVDNSGNSLIYYAVLSNMEKLVIEILELGARVMPSQFLLHRAIINQNIEIVKIVHQAGANLNVRDKDGNTPLMHACLHQNYVAAEYLLENGAPVNVSNLLNGLTALHMCAQVIKDENIFRRFLSLFLSYDVNLNAGSYYGNVLFYSIVSNNIPAACVLVQNGVDVNRCDENAYFDNLCLSKRHGNFELVKMVILAGFNFRNMMFNLSALRNCSGDPIFEFILYVTCQPMTLRDLCRIKIRHQLGKNLIAKLYRLPLPNYMQRFLALDIL